MRCTHPQRPARALARAAARALTLALTLALTSSLCACGGGGGLTTTDLDGVRLDVKEKKAELKSTQAAVETKDDYLAFLRSGQGSAVLIGPEAITQAITAMLPYPFQGKELMNGYLEGDFQVLSVHNFSFQPGNKARLTLKFKGEKIQAKVPSIYMSKSEVSTLKKALTGGELDIVVSAYIKDGALVLKPRCVDGRFNANIGKHKRDALNGINGKLMRKKKLKLGAPLPSTARLMTTPHHLVLLPR